jgi:hypothetical protein
MIVLDIILMVMICTCIVYSWMLNRRIQDLHNSRVEFARMIKELNVSIVKAESSVAELSELSKITNEDLKIGIDDAKVLIKNMSDKISIASNLIEKLDVKIEVAKKHYNQIEASQKFQSNINRQDIASEQFNAKRFYEQKGKSEFLDDTEAEVNVRSDFFKNKFDKTSSIADDHFDEGDFIDLEDQEEDVYQNSMKYTNKVKGFVHDIHHNVDNTGNFGQVNYYDTLRKISAKR